jgi:hypothetical protein
MEAPTVDLYRGVHRGLRWGLGHALMSLGSVELNDTDSLADVLHEVVTIAELCGSHIRHEEDYMHETLGRVSPALRATLEREHQEHFAQIEDLKRRASLLRLGCGLEDRASTPEEALVRRVWQSRKPQAEELRQDLYLRLSSFMAENLEHMREEEEQAQRAFDTSCAPQELEGIHMRLVQSIPFDQLVLFLRIMLPAITQEKRLELLAGPKAGMPPQVFAALLWQSATHLSEAERATLVERLEAAA